MENKIAKYHMMPCNSISFILPEENYFLECRVLLVSEWDDSENRILDGRSSVFVKIFESGSRI